MAAFSFANLRELAKAIELKARPAISKDLVYLLKSLGG
jgi:hypothetical protein